ncbi:MAG: alpha/beta fold hydrolase [Pseudomonadota bacterium]
MRALTPLLILALAGTAEAAEERVEIEGPNGTIVGTLETPPGDAAPVVLMLHGFTGSRDELAIEGTEDGVFSRTAAALAEAGYASLRIDFTGSGESGGAWAETTFSGQVTDAEEALDWLALEDRVDGTDMAILGWSQGGLVAAHVAAERPEIASLILWAPVVEPMATFRGIFGDETLTTALAAEPETPIEATLPWGDATTLNAAFFHEMPVTSTSGAIASYRGPLLVIVGSQDTVVAPQPASGQQLLDYHPGTEELLVLDTDHVWQVFEGPAVLDTEMIPATIRWLESN